MSTDARRGLNTALYVLFALSGVAGLIYESIWSHYLKLFLGHAAYAQTLVLAIFMGGMALGAWMAGNWAKRLRQPLMGYIVIEIILGLLGLGFDPMFRALQGWAFDSVIPVLGSPLSIDLFKWGLAGLVILPQCILLGATFPLMSSGLIRLNPDITGRTLAWLYFTNSLGASAGVLLSGFVLIALVGLPGTLLTAALLNFAVALGVWLLWAKRAGSPLGEALTNRVSAAAGVAPAFLIAASFVTGAASFLYEMGWIRMLSLVLGSATHAFELMLSAFIFGLAMGSFYLRRRIDHYRSPLWVLGWVQVWMAVAALLSLVLYGYAFDWMSAVMHTVQRNAGGYVAFNLFSHVVCLVLMLPATFLAGMTLPLITAILVRAGGGEAAIGRVYAANTLGAIVGVMLAIHVVMPTFGLRQVVVFGAVLDLALGLWLLRAASLSWSRPARLSLAVSLLVAAYVSLFVHFDASQLASGVFRFGEARSKNEVLFHRDGKTASVDVLRASNGHLSIATNGKVDAGIDPSGASSDDYTMILMGVLPLMLNPEAETVAVIGFGSGRSTHTLLQHEALKRVDTIEIEPAMVEGARYFGEFVSAAYDDPRSHIHIEDAKSFFARQPRSYDLIISEPSNPWVSGVASLFSEEFYGQVRRYLAPQGIFLQWLQGYEISPHLLGSVFNALGSRFSDYQLYATLDGDFLIVAVAHGEVPALNPGVLTSSRLGALAATVGVQSVDDMLALRLGSKRTLATYFQIFGAARNSDYFPVLDQSAVEQRFLGANASGLIRVQPYSARLEAQPPPTTLLSRNHALSAAQIAQGMQRLPDYLDGKPLAADEYDRSGLLARSALLLSALNQCNPAMLQHQWPHMLKEYVRDFVPHLTAASGASMVGRLRSDTCHARLDPMSRAWIDFIAAVAASDWPQVLALGDQLLPKSLGDNVVTEVLVSQMLMAELLGDGGRDAARARLAQWKAYPDTVSFNYLRAQAYRSE